MNRMYEMELHEQLTPSTSSSATLITRVPGGWIYTFYNQTTEPNAERFSSVFVPFHNEFQGAK